MSCSSPNLSSPSTRTALDIPLSARNDMRDVFDALMEAAERSGDPHKPFWYLGGPMTGIPQFNFPAFLAVAAKLREQGMNIISPAEIDRPDTFEAAMSSPDGAPGSGTANGESYEDFLGRDLILCSLPNCQGAILMPGWQDSRGAGGETWVAGFLKKPLFEFNPGMDNYLVEIDRDTRIHALGGDLAYMGQLPSVGRPGERTVGSLVSPLYDEANITDAEVVE